VSGFRLDKYLVTVGRFRAFVAAAVATDGGTGWTPPEGSGKHIFLNNGRGLATISSPGTYETGWIASDASNIALTNANLSCASVNATWTSDAGANETMPMNCVNWYEAYAFCIWDGGFLPSEAEWEYAAAGGDQQREFPWGTALPGASNQYAIYSCYYPEGAVVCDALRNVAPVGTAKLGLGRWGQLDLAGELFEWNLDWYNDYAAPCTDCANVTTAGYSLRVVRGGDFTDFNIQDLYPSYRRAAPPSSRSPELGFRCARAP
jgi:formylglycine-generating enzyme required for sulfatase activity